ALHAGTAHLHRGLDHRLHRRDRLLQANRALIRGSDLMQAMISARDVSKKYRLGGTVLGYGVLRERLAEMLRGSLRREKRASAEEFWALADVSFDVNQAEVVGLI